MRRAIKDLPDKDLAYFREGNPHFADYVAGVEWAQRFAARNRALMLARTIAAIASTLGRPVSTDTEAVNCHHNYVEKEHHFGADVWVTRKGAVRAGDGELGIIPGSMGALRIADTRARMPCAECQALCSCMDWKSLVPSMITTRSSGEWISMRWARPERPFRPGLKGSSQTVRRPFRQSSTTRTGRPRDARVNSMTPGQRWSNDRRRRVVGMIPQESESE
mgnify:CR=1 FL=1